ncbi:hypothetical protein BJX76DRAFT_357326 [Aspergillus varians]
MSTPSPPHDHSRPMVFLPSATPSDTSPSKPIEAVQPVQIAAPEWSNAEEAIVWFLGLRKAIKSIIYRALRKIQEAQKIFEDNEATEYAGYLELCNELRRWWAAWTSFSSTNRITSQFLSTTPALMNDGSVIIQKMKTPRYATKGSYQKMRGIREDMRAVSTDLYAIKNLVLEAVVRLEELPTETAPLFPSFPMFEDTPVPIEPEIPEDIQSQASRAAEEVPEPEENEEHAPSGNPDDPSTLDPMFYRPVWTSWTDFQGEIPEEIQEYLDGGNLVPMIGSNRSILALCGMHDIVDLIDDPAYSLTEEVIWIPSGCIPGYFLVNRYLEEGLLPSHIANNYLGYVMEPTPRRFYRVLPIPSIVTQTPSQHAIHELYPWCRSQSFQPRIRAVKIKHDKDIDRLHSAIRGLFPDSLLESNEVYFRGISVAALELSFSFFVPRIGSNNGDNEFGPGIYITKDFITARSYAGIKGSIMVFQNPDLRGLEIWNPTGKAWTTLVIHWRQLVTTTQHVPDEYDKADFIRGAISADKVGGSKGGPAPGSQDQLVAVSYRACERLAASLVAIIYII